MSPVGCFATIASSARQAQCADCSQENFFACFKPWRSSATVIVVCKRLLDLSRHDFIIKGVKQGILEPDYLGDA